MAIDLDIEKRVLLDAALERGESILWASSPQRPAWHLDAVCLFVVGCVCLFVVGGLFLDVPLREPDVGGGPARRLAYDVLNPVAWVFGVVFLIVGVGVLVSAVTLFLSARREFYALTSKRGLVIAPGRRVPVVEIPPDALLGSRREEVRGGLAVLRFALAEPVPLAERLLRGAPAPSFKNIAAADRVEAIIHERFGDTHAA